MTALDPGARPNIDFHLDTDGGWWMTCTGCQQDIGPAGEQSVTELVAQGLAHHCHPQAG